MIDENYLKRCALSRGEYYTDMETRMLFNENDLEHYILSRWEYAIGVDTRMTDEEYNSVNAMYKRLIPDNEYVKRVWSEDPCPLALLKKYGREDLYRNISIKYGSESIPSLRSMEEVEKVFNKLNKPTRLSVKLDGWNTQVNYYNGGRISSNSRGRDTNSIGTDVILDIVPENISLSKKVKIIGEAVIPNDKWEEYKLKTGNTGQRHSVSSVIANNDSGYVKLVAFNIMSTDIDVTGDKYQMLKEFGFEVPKFIMVNTYDELLSGIKMLGRMKKRFNYETDGLVVENDEIQVALRVGEWAEEDILSYVTGYQQSPTVYGLSMTLNVFPVTSNGVTISNPNITNINIITRNNLKKNTPVAFVMRSGANPVVNFVRTKMLQDEYEGRYDEYCKMIQDSQKMIEGK